MGERCGFAPRPSCARAAQRSGCSLAAACLLLLLCLLWPARAGAIPASGPHETVDITFSTTHPGTPAALTYAATYRNPADPSADPPALRRLVIVGPPGITGDTSAPGQCPATDAQLKAEGEAACPASSRVGSGMVRLKVLGGPPGDYPSTLFNNADEQVELVKTPAGNGVVRTSIHGRTLDGPVPTCLTGGQPPSGCPFDQLTLLSNQLATVPVVVASGSGRRSYLTTPHTCPASRHWDTSATLYYSDGAVETVMTQQPCTPQTPSGSRRRRTKAHPHRGRRSQVRHRARHGSSRGDRDRDGDDRRSG